MKDFQDMNCKGCYFADPETVGTGEPCCTHPGKLEIIMGRPLPNRADRPATENQEKEAA